MRIGAKFELGFDGDFFVGCELASELFAVIVGALGQDDEEAVYRIGPLGRVGGSGLGEIAYIPPPPGVYVFFAFRMWGCWATRFAGRERTKSLRQRNADQRKN